MVLSETVIFDKEDDAAEFTAFLRKKGCPFRKGVRGRISSEEEMQGALDTIIAWFEAEAQRCGEGADAAWFRKTATNYVQARERIGALLAGHAPGDILYTAKELEKAKIAVAAEAFRKIYPEVFSQMESVLGREVDRYGLPPGQYPLFMCHWMLKENGIITETPRGARLERLVPAGEVMIGISMREIPGAGMDHAPDLATTLLTGIDIGYVVTADPAIHFCCKPDEVMEALDGLDVDEDMLGDLEMNLAGKAMVIQAIIGELEREDGISVEDLYGRLQGKRIEAGEEVPTSELMLDKEVIRMIVAELRKRDLLAGNDQRVRLPGKGKRQEK